MPADTSSPSVHVKSARKPAKFILSLLFKIGFVSGIFVFLAQRGLLSLEATWSAFSHPELVYPPMAVLMGLTGFAALRWQWLMRAQGMNLPYRRVLQLTLIGNFFNIALPGAVSGDFVKVFYVSHDVPGRRGHAFGSILFDRIIGLCALVFVAAGALWGDWSELRHSSAFPVIRLTLSMGAAGIACFFGYLFFIPHHRDPVDKLLKRMADWRPMFHGVLKTYEGVRVYQNHKKTVALTLGMSIVFHIIVCWACLNFAHALGETALPVAPIFLFVPMGMLVTAVPIMPAGVGTGHAFFSWAFHLIGSDRGADVFSIWVLNNLLGGTIGGLVYLAHKRSHTEPPLPDEFQPE